MTTIQRIWRIKNTLLRLLSTRCLDCGFVAYPPKASCPKCGSRRLIKEELPKIGEVLSYTVINVPLRGFEEFTPLIICLIKLGEAKVLAELVDVKPGNVHIGMKVMATLRRSAKTLDGVIPYVVKFRPLSLGSS